jgi:lipid-A-disaccharide synthase
LKRVRVAIVAGESSGDLLGAAVVRALKASYPELDFYGIAGPKMMAEGVTTLFPLEKLAVRGYVEALKHLPEIFGIRRKLARQLLDDRPHLFIGIDAPDFNLGLEARLKSAGIRTVQYVGPSVWAWRPERLHRIHRSVDHVLVLFPFEEEIYRKAGVPVTFVGHPLADAMPLVPDRDDARAQLRLSARAPAVVLLPGSRVSELEWHADLMIRTARKLHASRPELRFFAPLATRETHDYFQSRLYALDALDLPVSILFGHATLALHAADAALVASGTATLEAALARCPMVITYRVPRLTYWMMKRKALLPYIGLPNILSGEFVVPELLQDEATVDNLAQALSNWLDAKAARERLRARFEDLHGQLACDHDARVADAMRPYLGSPLPA